MNLTEALKVYHAMRDKSEALREARDRAYNLPPCGSMGYCCLESVAQVAQACRHLEKSIQELQGQLDEIEKDHTSEFLEKCAAKYSVTLA